MSVIEVINPRDRHIIADKAAAGGIRAVSAKRRKNYKNSSFMELRMDTGAKSVKDIDPKLLKAHIKRWAKDVVAYAYNVTGCR